MLVVGGLMMVWATAKFAAKVRNTRQIRTRVMVAGPPLAALAAAVVRVEGLIMCAFPVTELQLHELFLLKSGKASSAYTTAAPGGLLPETCQLQPSTHAKRLLPGRAGYGVKTVKVRQF